MFLRTGLADSDDLDHMLEVARSHHPERPGELDFPAGLVGRRWCNPGTPACPTCPLTAICPKDLDRASRVA
jgi:endonuclease III